MSKLLLALVFTALVIVQGAHHHVIKEQLTHGAPHGWKSVERAAGDQELSMVFLIKQQNLAELESTLYAVSDPTSPQYGQHLSLAEVNELVQPAEQHISAVLSWLASHGIRTDSETMDFTPNRDMIRVQMTVAQAEKLLHTEYFEFAHASRKTQLVRTLAYKVPEFLVDIIDSIGPTVRFPSQATMTGVKKSPSKPVTSAKKLQHKTKKATPKPVNGPCDGGSTTPDCLKSLYSVNNYVAAAGTNSTVAVTGYLEQYIAPSDLAAFFAAYDPSHTRTANIIGPNDPTNPGTEASLDIQYSMGVAPGIPGTFWYTAGRQPNSTDNEPFLDFLMALATDASAPWVVSTSYGDDEPTVDFGYASRMNVEFQKLGARGISILFSSGDGGVSGGQSQQCTQFIPTYPAGSPFVTSVGGTTNFNPEVAVSFSSGGFTNYWSSPSYQVSAVQAYITNYGASTLPPQNVWNATGRGFPDVSAQGTNYPVYQGGFPMPVDGTSCSTPTFSAIVSLLNDIRFAAGKSSLGFLNPLFYQNPSMFTDITSGNNPGCGTNGFTSTQGWDPVTGLGTPNFASMASVIKNLP